MYVSRKELLIMSRHYYELTLHRMDDDGVVAKVSSEDLDQVYEQAHKLLEAERIDRLELLREYHESDEARIYDGEPR